MSREKLKEIIDDFSPNKFRDFFRLKSRTFRPYLERLSQYDDEDFTQALFIGEIPFDNGQKLGIYSFRVNGELNERSGKKKQYEKGKKVLKDNQVDAGIFIFYDENNNLRFSLIYTEYFGARRRFSYFKRFTFFVSPRLTNRTFLKQVGDGDFSSLEGIKEAFSVEPVTKEFYSELQSWYFWATDKVKFPEDYKYSNDIQKDRELRNATNLIRLITRIIFIWFLREKGLVTDELFDKVRLKSIVKDFLKDGSSNYYNAILQNLFFATLNQKIAERKFAIEGDLDANKKEYGVKNLYRYRDKFLISEEKVLELFKDIPFLNGGLFDCLDKEDDTGRVIYIDGFSRNPKKQAIISDYLFFQENEEGVDLSNYELGRNRPVRGLFEILKNYNFTVDESSSIDQEIALDPELLGKVFENLLACYTPETATTARKATGSYYTPREIVDYMVEESLYEYLKTHFPEIEEEKIRLLLSYSEEVPELSEEEKKRIIKAIDEIKILDPACGSGAFPMGILHRMVYILQKLDPDNSYWRELQYEKALKATEEVFREPEKDKRGEMLKDINEAFDENMNYPDYARKLYLIENCIYGVDIQPIAIQISKLRFFISLILDQKVDKSRDNFGIKPLPNLETKFVSANTLIGLEKPKQLRLGKDIIRKEQEEFKYVRHKYFNAKTRKEKLACQREDKRLRRQIAEKLKLNNFPEETAEKIANFDIFDQNASANWFDPEWMFGISVTEPSRFVNNRSEDASATSGFDIVIGNPPYGIKLPKTEDIIKTYTHYDKQKNSAAFFIEFGYQITGETGVVSYIVPKSLSFSEGWEKTRELITKKANLFSIIDVSKAFENVKLEQVIICFSKNLKSTDYEFYVGEGWNKEIKITGKVKCALVDELGIIPIYGDDKKLAIARKIKSDSIPLSLISKTCRGLPYQNKISEHGYPILRGRNINKYIIYREIDKINLSKSDLHRHKIKEIMKPKIISQNILAHVMNPYDRIIVMATYDREGLLTLDTVMNTFLINDSFSYEYILGIINSRLTEWFYYWFVYNRAIRTMHFDEYYIGKMPIKRITPQTQPIAIQIESLVSQILSFTQSDDYLENSKKQAEVKELENQIDRLVYKLYGLTEEEIKMLDII